MANGVPRLDHVVVDVRGRIAEAAAAYRALGFHMTERSRHTMGSSNHLAVFGTDYLELLGIDQAAAAARPEIASYPIGLNGLVFYADDADRIQAALTSRGVPALEANSFSRPVRLADGTRDAKFRVVRLAPGSASFGRVYFCHHFTPELVWRPEWRGHANGAVEILRVAVAVRDPAAAAQFFAALFGPQAVRKSADGGFSLTAGRAEILLMTHAALTRHLGDAAPDPAGRADYMAALELRTNSLPAAAAALAAGGVAASRVEPRRILVPAQAAMNVALAFVE